MDLLDGRLKFRHLTLLIAVYECGSVVRAAESLHLTQPAATRTLRELEAVAELPLFVRVPRGMRPTVYGEALVGHARAVVAEVRRAEEHLTGLRQGRDGTVTVGTLLAGANVLLPRAVARLKRERPRLTVVVREGTPDVLHPALLGGELDVIVGRMGTAPGDGEGEKVRQRTLYREPIRLAVRAGHPLLAGDGGTDGEGAGGGGRGGVAPADGERPDRGGLDGVARADGEDRARGGRGGISPADDERPDGRGPDGIAPADGEDRAGTGRGGTPPADDERPDRGGRGGISLTDALAHPWILPVEQTALRQELGALFVERGLSLPADRVECTSILTMRALLLQTDMVALLPELVLRDDEQLAALPVELPSVGRTVGVTEAAHRTRTPALEALLRHLDEEAALLRASLGGGIREREVSESLSER
ncbi:LysR substrate-binding domain-containing protein [Streptomyces griseus]|uniref:LysR substrate-binding domain-containing protein n=1 Tax=Streptomyces griseus TaxID=1911 RepID=UPI000AF42830|nr:LysR substrate-binding domain-containing protein [Streptomyces griseus]